MMYAELKRTCKSCSIEKPLTEFYYKNLNKEGRCKACVSELRKISYVANKDAKLKKVQQYRMENPEKIRDTKLKQAFGIGVDWYNDQFEKQNGTCASCKKPESTIWRGRVLSLAVDHDHFSGEIRGLLCMRCNRALGLLDDDEIIINNLLGYIRKFKK